MYCVGAVRMAYTICIRNFLCWPFADGAIAIEDADGKKTVTAAGQAGGFVLGRFREGPCRR